MDEDEPEEEQYFPAWQNHAGYLAGYGVLVAATDWLREKYAPQGPKTRIGTMAAWASMVSGLRVAENSLVLTKAATVHTYNAAVGAFHKACEVGFTLLGK